MSAPKDSSWPLAFGLSVLFICLAFVFSQMASCVKNRDILDAQTKQRAKP